MTAVLVGEIMTREVVTLRPEDSIESAIMALLEYDVGGVPVVDEQGFLVGLLSDGDLIVRQSYLHVPTIFTLFLETGRGFTLPSLEAFAGELRRALGSRVAEVMDAHPPTCDEGERVEIVATRMLEHGAHRLPVLREGRVVGIVARADLLELMVGPRAPAKTEDAEPEVTETET